MATSLIPAEALVLLKLKRTPASEAIKVTMLSLMAQGLLRIEETMEKGFLRQKKVVHIRPTGRTAPTLPPAAASLLEVATAAQVQGGKMIDLVVRARQAYGANLAGFRTRFIDPVLVGRGLIEKERVAFLFNTWRVTPAGAAEQNRINDDIARARTIPALLRSDPKVAAAVALAVGSAILLVPELRPYYRQMSDAMRQHTSDAWDGGDAGDWGAHDGGSGTLQHTDLSGASALDLGSFDLSSFDADAFGALDAGMASFDAGFDASVGGDGGDGGGGHSGD